MDTSKVKWQKNKIVTKRVTIEGHKRTIKEIPYDVRWIEYSYTSGYRIYQKYNEDKTINKRSRAKHKLIASTYRSYLLEEERTYVIGREFTVG